MSLQFWVRFLATVAIAAVFFPVATPLIPAESAQNASVEITNASHALRAAFIKVSEAERDGVNVSGLINRLNKAGNILTSAQGALEEGNYLGATSQAVSVTGFANDIALDATGLMNQATTQPPSLLLSLLFTLAGSAALVAVLFLVWHHFKQNYTRRLLKTNPRLSG